MIPESRKIAQFLLSHPDKHQWKAKIEVENLLQKRSTATASRIATLIRSRLILMTEELWEMIAHGDSRLATHAAFAASIKHCPLLGDYLDFAIREQFHKMEERLSVRLWEDL